jgi:ATP-dependent Clp protease adaptor protein ClpS
VKRTRQIFYASIEETDTLEEIQVLEDLVSSYQIVIYNDDINTFDWVIKCLESYCEHTHEQAEQCAWFIHFKGKYAVKSGSKVDLKPICQTLQEKGLNAKIEKN